jgi:hypothetical protein
MTEYESALRTAQAELAALSEERLALEKKIQEIDARTMVLGQTIGNLKNLVNPAVRELEIDRGGVVASKLGLRAACIRVLRATSPKSLTVLDFRKLLQSIGYDVERYHNPTAAVSTTLERLVTGKLASVVVVEGKKAYSYRGSGSGLND